MIGVPSCTGVGHVTLAGRIEGGADGESDLHLERGGCALLMGRAF